MRNQCLIFRSVPRHGLPVPGQDLAVMNRPLDPDHDVHEGDVLIRIDLASLDPHTLSQLRDPSSSTITTGHPALPVGEPVRTTVIGTVVRSSPSAQALGFPPGEQLWLAVAPLAEYMVVHAAQLDNSTMVMRLGEQVSQLPGVDAGHWLGILGLPGLTGFAGLYECGRPAAGQTIYISSAAGTVGLAVAYCSRKDGLRVVGSAGSDAKARYLAGTDLFNGGVFNYNKTSGQDIATVLRGLAPQGLDVHFANVGGDHLRATIACMNPHGRVVLCNAVDEYDSERSGDTTTITTTRPNVLPAVWRWQDLVYKRITIQGFLITDLSANYVARFRERMREAVVRDGLADVARLHVVDGIDGAAQALVDLVRSGSNVNGKLVVRLHHEGLE